MVRVQGLDLPVSLVPFGTDQILEIFDFSQSMSHISRTPSLT